MIHVATARPFRRPAAILQALINERDRSRREQREAVVCYGVNGPQTGPCLNRSAGHLNKLSQGLLLMERGVDVVTHLAPEQAFRLEQEQFPIIGRRITHMGGQDISIALSPEDVQPRIMAGAQFFTVFSRSDSEVRVFVYRKTPLVMYRKILRYPARYRGFGRNYDNGWAFQLLDNVNAAAGALAIRAVWALNLDFGAVDMLERDGRYKVLEVNTAPGIESEGRLSAIRLANKIVRWKGLGFPERSTWRR